MTGDTRPNAADASRMVESTADGLAGAPLGKPSVAVSGHRPELLHPVPRAPQRRLLGVGDTLPFVGADLWTAYELSWLNARGKPQVAIAQLLVPCDSPNLVESKSLKLYLNGLADLRFDSADALRETVVQDLSAALWRGAGLPPERLPRVGLTLIAPDAFDAQPVHELDGLSLDRLDIECSDYGPPRPELLTAALDEQPVEEVLTSRLLRSNCLVTGQPDWGSVQIRYHGPQIDQAGLLRYLVSYRNHSEFHEHCVERIFCDIRQRCRPARLSVYARYTRRGGLDINPWRASHPAPPPPNLRTARQ